jgi:hypothetical protein
VGAELRLPHKKPLETPLQFEPQKKGNALSSAVFALLVEHRKQDTQQFLLWHHKHSERKAGNGGWGRCAAP